MKALRQIQSLILILCLMATSSCDKNFEKINTSPDLVEVPNPDNMLPYMELTLMDADYYTNVAYAGEFVHQVHDLSLSFDRLIAPSIGNNGNYHFDYSYTRKIKNTIDFIEKTKDAEMINYQCIGRILKAYAFHSITDLYGDVPYFQAGKGYSEKAYTPKYDEQKLIYNDMLNELADAAAKFDATKKTPGIKDIIYQGDINKWKKFAYSLMLRLGLRMVKVDPDNSKKWVNNAVQGGLMQSTTDNCIVYYTSKVAFVTTANGQPYPLIAYPTCKLAEPFVAFLRDNFDPRLKVYASLPNGDTARTKQLGLPPLGSSSSVTLPYTSYSTSPANTFGRYDAPFIHLSYAQVQYLLAEAVVRGFITGNAKTLYENGVRSAMKQLAVYGEQGKISDIQIDDYLVRKPYNPATSEDALNLINTQYWVETHYNWYETYSNWRRTGYPRLDESRFKLPRRLPYPIEEVNINNENVQAAVSRQGPDDATTKVWWDK